MTRFEAPQQADIYPRVPDPQVDLLSLVLGKNPNPLVPPPTSTTTNDVPTNDVPVATTEVTNFPVVVTTTVITTGNDRQPATLILTNTEIIVLPTTTNRNDPNPVVATRTGSAAPNHTTTSSGSDHKNGGTGTSTARKPSGMSTMLSEPASGVVLKASLAAPKGCMSSCDWQFGMTGTGIGSNGLSPTGGTGDRPANGRDNSNLGALIGGVAGAIIGAVSVVLAIYFLVRRARRRWATANVEDATGLLSDVDALRFMHPRSTRQSRRMTIETRLQRSPSFGTLYGLTYNPDVAGGSVLSVGNSPIQWKPYTPSVPLRVEPESPICPNSPGSDAREVHRDSIDDRPRAGRVTLPDGHDHCRSPGLSAAAVAENPFAAEEDPPEHGNGTASGENLDVK